MDDDELRSVLDFGRNECRGLGAGIVHAGNRTFMVYLPILYAFTFPI